MDFAEYQKRSRDTAVYPDAGSNFIYPTLGLAGEAGEVANKIKKFIRDDGVNSPQEVSAEKQNELQKELGDVLWYVAQLATEFEFNLDDIAESNLERLKSRKDRGVLSGEGDNR